MSNQSSIVSSAAVLAAVSAKAAEPTAVDQACAAFPSYDYGSSRAVLMPLDDAVRASLGDAAARQALERRLVALLQGKLSRPAKEYICGQLVLIGSAESVPALAEMLADPDLSVTAQRALAAIPQPAAAAALRDQLPKLSGLAKAGVINTLGMRRDETSVPVLAALLTNADSQVASAAAAALGNIGTTAAAQALRKFQPDAAQTLRAVVADACLACAERLLSQGKKTEARALYQALTIGSQPRHVQQAAQRGLEATGTK